MLPTLTLRAMLLVLFVSVCATAQTRTLALYAGPAQGLEPASKAAMIAELQRLLSPADVNVVWKDASLRKAGEDFELIAVASFDGSCSAAQRTFTLETASLADTSVSDGGILPFFHVDCARVIQMLGARVEPAVAGRALARVIAHELYHIVARTANHHDTGVAKAVFSTRDLTTGSFAFDPWSISRMRATGVARVWDSSDADSR